jgi:hypothetical protein
MKDMECGGCDVMHCMNFSFMVCFPVFFVF